MNQHITRIVEILTLLTEELPGSKNPIGFRLMPLLLEMDWAVKHIIHFLQKQNNDQDNIKQYISIMYRDDEAADPLMRGWLRAAEWMESPELPEVMERRELYKSLRNELKSLVPYVESIYGKKEARFIIPPLFRG